MLPEPLMLSDRQAAPSARGYSATSTQLFFVLLYPALFNMSPFTSIVEWNLKKVTNNFDKIFYEQFQSCAFSSIVEYFCKQQTCADMCRENLTERRYLIVPVCTIYYTIFVQSVQSMILMEPGHEQ